MIRGPTTSFHNLVATAVLNKYGNGSSLQIDNLVSTTTDAIASDTECRLISRLAHVFGSVIRVHPFEDGNGRTARLFAFYALKCWGRPLFPIPKVRNDSSWKVAMDSAVAGDALKLKDELFWRMEEAVKSVDSSERR